ncbi:MAG: type III-B CRISPR module RAMP protein Cmr4 [Nitrospirae bacterium]|nr:type III-B CRISPR module RAMP protein Cmr4 [Nitrospirota bacterium]
MFKKAKVMFIYTETSLHCGSGTSLVVIDLPIQREKYTDYPVCQASGVKGVVREWFEVNKANEGDKIKWTFGPDFSSKKEENDAHAGAATFTDARLLLFPVRSLNGVFAYTTSRFALSRLKRDLEMAGVKVEWTVPAESGDDKIFGVQSSKIKDSNDKVVLEEYTFDFHIDDSVKKIAEWIASKAIPPGDEYQFWRDKVKTDLLILPEDAFRDFVKLSTEVQARIQIDNETKTVKSGALFYEEALSSDSLLYSVVMAHDPACNSDKRPEGLKNDNEVMAFISAIDTKRLQFGGDATIGKGIVNVNLLNGVA